jgi:hypothetical protein
VIVFALGIVPHLKYQGVQAVTYPPDRTILLRNVGTLIKVIRMREDLLRFLEPDSTLWVCPKPLAFPYIELEPYGITVIP